MRNIYYYFNEKEMYRELVITLSKLSEDPDGKVGYLGGFCKFAEEDKKRYNIFTLSNGAGISSSTEGGLVGMCIKNGNHLKETIKLLSNLTKIPEDKFIIAR